MNTALQANSTKGASTPADYGDVHAEFQALLAGCGVYDLSSRSKIALTGGDRTRWLNGMVTNNIRDLAPNYGAYCFLLNAQGHIQADLYAFNRGESLLVDVESPQREKVLQLFDHYIIADDVEVADISSSLSCIGIAGPNAPAVMRAAGIQVPELAPLELGTPKCECDCRCLECTVVRGDDPAGTSYQIWLAPETRPSTRDALVQAGATPVGAKALELRRISQGIPLFGIDIRERDLPQETAQARALNFTKGCYLGQEIVERIRSRGTVHRLFTAFAVEGALPAPGTKIEADAKEVGEITSSANLPLAAGDRAIALGYLRREAVGKSLRAGTATLTIPTIPIR